MTHLLLAIIYLAFISLGLPDALLGSAWPSIYPSMNVPISYAGIISMIIALGTIFSSLQSDRLTFRFGTGKVTAFSVATTAVALFGFSISHSFLALCLWAIPYGLGAGSVDASLNNYVALHYESKHMSWLHCMWGIGASVGPYIMGLALTRNWGWNNGYRMIGIIQVVLVILLFVSLPLWNHGAKTEENVDNIERKAPLKFTEVVGTPGVKAIMISFFCYCAIEQTAGLWAASYMTLHKGIAAETAASYASMFFIGITIGRALSGFITMKLNDMQMIRLGQVLIATGIIIMIIPATSVISLIGLIVIGLGCAPIYPSLIHTTPERFGAVKSQAIIGVEMASAYVGTCIMPPIFGLIANGLDVKWLPIYLFGILALMCIVFQRLAGVKKEA